MEYQLVVYGKHKFYKGYKWIFAERDTTMVLTTEFYDYLHELEKRRIN